LNFSKAHPERFDAVQNFEEFGHRFDRAFAILEILVANESGPRHVRDYEPRLPYMQLWDLTNDELFEMYLLARFYARNIPQSSNREQFERQSKLATQIVKVIERRIAIRSGEIEYGEDFWT
jgi:hypothetical protein